MTTFRTGAVLALAGAALAACAVGPKFEPRVAQTRDAPVLANLSAHDSLARARTFLSARQYGLAIELFKAAKQDTELAADALNGLAIAYDGIGRRDLAERYFQEALAARPGDERTQRNLASFYQSSGQAEKRRVLLATAPPVASAPKRAIVEADEADEAPAARDGDVSESDPVRPRPVFAASSPLGAALRPLRVQAGLDVSPRPVLAPAAVRDEVSIVCSGEPRTQTAVSAGAPMAMFRISVGEVFIAARPAGSLCRVDEPAAGEEPSPAVSNKEYLGLVAAYLDHLNKSIAPSEVAALWRAAFWADGIA